MTINGWIDRLHALLTQANAVLLAGREPGTLYLESADLCLLMEAERSDGYVDITVTALPLTSPTTILQAMPLFLMAPGWLRYGVFNQRGQISFTHVALQPYQLSTTEEASQAAFRRDYCQRFSPQSLPLAAQSLILLPPAALATMQQAVLADNNGCFHCANADATIQVQIQKSTDNRIDVTVQSQKRLWEQNPLGLYQPDQRPRTAVIDRNANSMAWDETREQYCATFTLDPRLLQNNGLLTLPIQPLPLELWSELAAPQPPEQLPAARSTQADPPASPIVTPGGLLATVSEAVRRVWVRDPQDVIWINFIEGFLGQAALQPALVVKGDPPALPGAVSTQFSLGPDELGDLDLSVQAIVEDNTALCTLVVKAQIPSRWPRVSGVRVILLRNEEFCSADTDESGKAFFPALPIEQLKRIGFKIELTGPPE